MMRVNVPKTAPRRVQANPNESVVHWHFILTWDFLWNLPKLRRLACTSVHEYKGKFDSSNFDSIGYGDKSTQQNDSRSISPTTGERIGPHDGHTLISLDGGMGECSCFKWVPLH